MSVVYEKRKNIVKHSCRQFVDYIHNLNINVSFVYRGCGMIVIL